MNYPYLDFSTKGVYEFTGKRPLVLVNKNGSGFSLSNSSIHPNDEFVSYAEFAPNVPSLLKVKYKGKYCYTPTNMGKIPVKLITFINDSGYYLDAAQVPPAPSNFDALNDPKKNFYSASDFEGIPLPFYMLVAKNDNFLMPDKWDSSANATSGSAKGYKAGDIIKVTALTLDTRPNGLKSKMLITDDGKAIWAAGIKPQDQTFSLTKPSETQALGVAQNEKMRSQIGVSDALGWIGVACGLGLAYKKGSGFWGYVGYAVLGGAVGTVVGKAGSAAFKKSK